MKDPAPSTRLPLQTYSTVVTGPVLLLAFFLRLWRASGTFLNLDEAMHFLAANKSSLAEAYRSSLNLAHPPLLILFLNVWKKLGTSELALRLPSVIAGTIFCWIFLKWLTRLLGPVTGWVGFVLVGFLPPFVELSSEIRQYPFLLCFLMASAYVLELALAENSVGKMSAFFVFLYLGMLTHFSAILFAGAVGIYSIWRLFSGGTSGSVVTLWITGQGGALGLFAFLYRTHIVALRDSGDAQHMQAMLSNSYFHPGDGHVIPFVFARSFGIFQYTFGQLAVGDIAGVLFVVAITLLLSGDRFPNGEMKTPDVKIPSPRELGLYLVLPFVINCVAAIAGLYPYGGTRHSAFLVPFGVAGVSGAMVKIFRQKLPRAMGSTILTIAICQFFGAPHRPYMHREDQRRVNMTQAIGAIRQEVSPADTIFVDFQTNVLLRFYLCPEAGHGAFTAPFKDYSCGGYRVISTSPETTILTADIIARRWNDMVSAYNLKPGQTVWIFQAGWDISLARDLQEKIPELHDLKAQSFGRNISLFRLTTDHTGTAALAAPNPVCGAPTRWFLKAEPADESMICHPIGYSSFPRSRRQASPQSLRSDAYSPLLQFL